MFLNLYKLPKQNFATAKEHIPIAQQTVSTVQAQMDQQNHK